ncbi:MULTISPECIES: DUF4153 domain-containing protein [unclassified Corallococcus]|uniref:DUF4153 domain-containing protein n=1 Tax=unclassified Corallococcus TaxID=2685029 RepID=UPI001A8EA207|nr:MULTISPECIES: DUF4173 domain-containing protein [unclassified Corallococcus]MBN9683642.1 DUF4173 domain-containing protein [Corallococcus sp. NCSPR001]WAS84846.1 DUF4173 domain-containing protein [Corallococcus sp. NCRR]
MNPSVPMSPLPPSPAPTVTAPARPLLPWVRAPRRTLAASLALGVLAEVLLDRARWGLGFPLLVAALVGALAWLGGREGWQRARPNAWLLAPLGLVSVFVAVRDSSWLLALNVMTAAVLLMMLSHFWAAGRVQRLGLADYLLVFFGSAAQSLLYPPVLVRDGVNVGGLKTHSRLLGGLSRGLLLALPVLLVFGVLLQSADGVFSSTVQRLLSFDLDLERLVGRGIGVAFGACVAAGVLGHALRRRATKELGDAEVTPATPRLGLIEALTLIFAVNALFFVFAAFQVAYLFVGDASSPAAGYTFAEYARRGFFELVVVASLTLALVMALTRWTRRETRVAQTVFRASTSLMVVLTLIILASAMRRLSLYEDAFGYTLLRVHTHVFMVALGAALAWRAVTLWWKPERFAVGAFATALGSVLVLNFLNPEVFIVRHNLERTARTGGSLDTEMFFDLSADAVPGLVQAASTLQNGDQWRLETVLREHRERLSQRDSVPEWNVSRFLARRALLRSGAWSSPGPDGSN